MAWKELLDVMNCVAMLFGAVGSGCSNTHSSYVKAAVLYHMLH